MKKLIRGRLRLPVLAGLTIALVAALVGAAGGGTPNPGKPLAVADVVMLNGKIVTMDNPDFTSDVGTIAQAMAVKDDKIVAIGSNAEVRRAVGGLEKTEVWDLEGRTVLPSFTLTHEHPTDWAWSNPETMKRVIPNDTDFLKYRWLSGTPEEQFASWESTLKEMAADAKPGQWLWLSFSLGPNFEKAEDVFASFEEAVTKERVDEIAPDNPVRVKAGWPLLNVDSTRAMAELKRLHPNITDREAEDDRWMEPYGIMDGQTELLAKMLKAEMELWTAFGVTAFNSHPYNVHNLQALAELDRRGEMPARFAWGYGSGFGGPAFDQEHLQLTSALRGNGTPYLFNNGASPGDMGGSCSTLDAPPEVKERESCAFEPGSENREQLERIIRTGGRIGPLHTYGDKDIDYLLDAIEGASKEAGMTKEEIRAKRHAFDHSMGAPRQDQIPRIKDLGMMVSMINTVIWENRTGYDASFRVEDYGEQAAATSVPRKSVTEAGIMNGSEIDRPMPHKVFYNAWAGMTRCNEGRQRTYAPEEGTDRVVQLKSLTTWGAHYLRRENVLGSLEVDKTADFVVLDRDYLTVPEDDIPQLKVLLTAVDGKVQHLRPELAQEIGREPVGPVTWPTRPLAKYFVQPPVKGCPDGS